MILLNFTKKWLEFSEAKSEKFALLRLAILSETLADILAG